MSASQSNPRIYPQRHPSLLEEAAFLVDRQARGLSPRTVAYYREKLNVFSFFLSAQGVCGVREITPQVLRSFLLHRSKSHSPGGVQAVFRAVKAFLHWWEDETEPDDWPNPLRKVKTPRASQAPLPPVDLKQLRAMLATCKAKTFTGDRDKAALLFFLDSGVRRAEFCALDVGDVNLRDGTVLVRHGKGDKRRITFVGAKTRWALLAYLWHRPDLREEEPLWVTAIGTRLGYTGVREIVRRRAQRAVSLPLAYTPSGGPSPCSVCVVGPVCTPFSA